MSVFISAALVASPSAQATVNNPIIGWHNLVRLDGVTADEEDEDYPATNLASASTAERWQAETAGDQYLTFDVAVGDAAVAVDYVGIARHNLGTGVVVTSVEAYDEGEEEWVEVFGEMTPGNDEALLLRFAEVVTTQVRLKLQPGSVIPRIAVVYIGSLLVLPRTIYVGHTPITLSPDQSIQENWSESGDFLGSVLLASSRSTSFSISNVEPDWLRANMADFLNVCRLAPWFFAWRPGDYSSEVGFVIAKANPRPVNQRPNGMMQIEFQVGGIAA